MVAQNRGNAKRLTGESGMQEQNVVMQRAYGRERRARAKRGNMERLTGESGVQDQNVVAQKGLRERAARGNAKKFAKHGNRKRLPSGVRSVQEQTVVTQKSLRERAACKSKRW